MIGTTRTRVSVELRHVVQTPMGQEKTWQPVVTLWARIVVLDPLVQVQFQQVGTASARWRLYFRDNPESMHPDLRFGMMRFRWDDQQAYPMSDMERLGKRFAVIGLERDTHEA